MTTTKRLLLALPVVATLGMALTPSAEAHDRRGAAIAAGALLGLGAAALATGAFAAPVYAPPPPVAYAPPPVYAPAPVYAPPPVVYAPPPPAYAYGYAPPPPPAYAYGYAAPRRVYEGHWVDYRGRRWREDKDD